MTQTHLKLASLVVVIGIVTMLGVSIANRSGGAPKLSDGAVAPTSRPINRDITLGGFESPSDDEADTDDETGLDPSLSDLSLRVGVISATPMRSEVTSIAALPGTISEVRRAYRDSRDRSCRVLIPGTPVTESHVGIAQGKEGTFGRVPTFTIGLELDPAGRSKLPTAVLAQVERYFRKHRLSIQPTLYHDKEGKLYFGTDCQTAFYEVARPGVTVKAEPMIDTAIERFRALGIVGAGLARSNVKATDGEQSVPDKLLGRTLAMAFTFERANQTTFASDSGRNSTELLLLHLSPDATVKNPQISVFVTSDDLATLHRLDILREQLNSPIPTITAEVRFGSTILLGLYPSNPIVTNIRYRSGGVVAMESIRRATLASLTSGEQGLSVTEVLDQFAQFSRSGGGFSSEARDSSPEFSIRSRSGTTYQDPTLSAPLPKTNLRTGL